MTSVFRRILGICFLASVPLGVQLIACSPTGGGGPDSGGGGDVCSAHANCDDCLLDFENKCAWCAGGCQVNPQPSDTTGAWCSYGFASLDNSACSKADSGALDQTKLPLDCRSGKNVKDPRCSLADSSFGQVGSGLPFPSGLGSLGGGYIDAKNNRLVVSAFFNNANTDQRHGAVFAVDLTTGNRTLLSATYVDGQQTDQAVGSGPDLPGVDDVKPSPDGTTIYALTGYAGNKFDGIFKIDPTSGNRTLLYDPNSTPCMFASKNWVLIDVVGAPSQTMAVAPDGTIYVPTAVDGNGNVGIAALQPSGACSIVTMGSQTAQTKKGTGPIAYGTYSGLVLSGTTLYAEAVGEIHSIDIATGNRKLVVSSTASPKVGTGPIIQDGYMTLENATTLLSSGPSTTSGHEFHAYDDVDIATGNRTPHDSFGPPFPGTLVDDHWFIAHPTMQGILIAVLDAAVLLYEPATGASMILSY